jgi:HEAT repeat protein
MTTTLQELADRLHSQDPDVRGLALGELVRRGDAALPLLVAALQSPPPLVRALAAEGLGLLGNPACADRLAAALHDPDEQVRSQAATALARVGDPRALQGLIDTLDDNYDLLQADLTLSAYTLSRAGPDALPALAPLLKDHRPSIRTQAIWIIRRIAAELLDENTEWAEFWESLGSSEPNAPAPERDRSADRWAAWIEAQTGRRSS